MNRGKAAVDRLVTLLLAVLFGGLAFWSIGQYFDVAAAQHISEVADRDFWAGLADRESYVTILVLAAVVLGVIGLILVGINTGRRKLGRMVSPASNSLGAIRTTPTDIASAVAQSLARLDDVTAASHRTTRDRGTDVIEVRVRVLAETDMTLVEDACSTAASDIAAALPNQDIRPRFLIETERPARRNR